MKHRALILGTLVISALASAWAQDSIRQDRQAAHAAIGSDSDMGSPMLSSIAGAVQSVGGKAIREARIDLRDLTGRTLASTYSLPNGTFLFNNVPHGRFEVVATNGIREARQQVNVDASLSQISLRLATDEEATGNRNSVTISEMKVPDKAREAVDKAEEAFHKRKLQEARKQTEKALHLAPHYAHALTLEGVLDLNENKLDQAQQELESAIQSDSRYGMAYVVLGAVYNMRSHFDDALRTLRQGISMVPNSWQAYFESAKALLGKRQYGEALHEADRAAQFAPGKYPPLHLVRAHALLGMNNFGEAANELEAFLASEPDGADSASARQMLQEVRNYLAANQPK